MSFADILFYGLLFVVVGLLLAQGFVLLMEWLA